MNQTPPQEINENEFSRSLATEQELRNVYYDPAEGYQSIEKLYQKAREKGVQVSRQKVKDWLKTQDTYTRYKPIRRKHKFQKTYAKGLADQIQLDLIDMGKYKYKNKVYYWILTGIEILSRYAFAIPVKRYKKHDRSGRCVIKTV